MTIDHKRRQIDAVKSRIRSARRGGRWDADTIPLLLAEGFAAGAVQAAKTEIEQEGKAE